MKRMKTYRGQVPAHRLALGLSKTGEIGVAVKQGETEEVFVFFFTSDEQIEKFITDLEELKYEREMKYQEFDDSPVQRLINER